MPPGRAPMIDEQRFKPHSLKQARQLYSALTPHTQAATARSMVTWLIAYPDRSVSEDPAMRTRYRRILCKLGSPPWEHHEAMGAYITSNDDQAA